MSTSIAISPQNYFSTHNALAGQQGQDNAVFIYLKELEGSRHACISVYPFYDIQTLKRLLIKRLKLGSNVTVNDIRMIFRGTELPNYRNIGTFLNFIDESRKELLKIYWCFRTFSENIGIRTLNVNNIPGINNLISDILLGFKCKISPKLSLEGTGGTYFLYNKRRRICAIFKPIDEEPFAPCNPRGYHGKLHQRGFRSGVLSGEGASREVAAYIIDSSYGNFCNVPPTTLVEVRHFSLHNKEYYQMYDYGVIDEGIKWKTGSLQSFIETREICGNFDPNMFSISDVHRIGIFDLCVLNLDRNDGNILVKNLKMGSMLTDSHRTPLGDYTKYSLIPIDHGLILPDVLDITELDLVWFNWPQIKVPFSPDELEHIRILDPDRDAIKLKRKLLIRNECLRTMRVTTRLVKMGAQYKLTLHEIASFAIRNNADDLSPLELVISSAIQQAYLIFDSTRLVSSNRLKMSYDLIQPTNSRSYLSEKMHQTSLYTDQSSELSEAESSNSESDALPSSVFFDYRKSETFSDDQESKVVDTGWTKSTGTFRMRKPFKGDNTTWSLQDSHGKPIQLAWDDIQFEYFFFQVFEKLLGEKLQQISEN